ncbi:hypothetical protein CBS101457_006327 [Exobasidium rhododendri]|nr:hypothetical protein CBS101457_006327 [Exobasidium rhododendri]
MTPKRKATVPTSISGRHCWLMKAEPDSRIVKGQDVAFSVDIFHACPEHTSAWDGVRNAEANKMMRSEMKGGDDVLFYHSNCKLPGANFVGSRYGLAKVVREGYADHNAWDISHPYYDEKSDKDNPRWFMVDVQLLHKLPYLVPLALLQYLQSTDCSHSLPYLTRGHLDAISKMQLLNRGRLSVQRVEVDAFEAVSLLGDKGGWQDWPGKWKAKSRAGVTSTEKEQIRADAGKKPAAAKGKREASSPQKEAKSEPKLRSSKRLKMAK